MKKIEKSQHDIFNLVSNAVSDNLEFDNHPSHLPHSIPITLSLALSRNGQAADVGKSCRPCQAAQSPGRGRGAAGFELAAQAEQMDESEKGEQLSD
jgi:hypothetical protein